MKKVRYNKHSLIFYKSHIYYYCVVKPIKRVKLFENDGKYLSTSLISSFYNYMLYKKLFFLLDYLTEELEFDIDNSNINDRKLNNNGK